MYRLEDQGREESRAWVTTTFFVTSLCILGSALAHAQDKASIEHSMLADESRLEALATHCRKLGADDSLSFVAGAFITKQSGSASKLSEKDGWFKDDEGRYALFRGVNFASRSKLPPYLPTVPLSDTTLNVCELWKQLLLAAPKIRILRDLGVNVVRLLVIWKALEPEPNPHPESLEPRGEQYLGAIRILVDWFYKEGIFVLLDFHQDIASEAFGGDGFPDWAIATKRVVQQPAPDKNWGARYYGVKFPFSIPLPHQLHRDVRTTLGSFWRDDLTNIRWHDSVYRNGLVNYHVQSHLVKVIENTARYFDGSPGVLGYEPFNEPNPVGIDKEVFDTANLTDYYRAVVAGVHSVDRNAFLFLEPIKDWTTFARVNREPVFKLRDFFRLIDFTKFPNTYLRLPRIDDSSHRLVFAFHFYDPWLALGITTLADKHRYWALAFARMKRNALSNAAIPFLTEFGCTQDWTQPPNVGRDTYGTVTRACIDLQYQQVEAQMINAVYWNYDLYATDRHHDNWNDENLSLLRPDGTVHDADIVARPYPERSSAEPEKIFFDSRTKTACIRLKGVPVEAPSLIFVPRKVQYGSSFIVRTTDTASRVRWDEGSELLLWNLDPNASSHQIVISPENDKLGRLPEDCGQTLATARQLTLRIRENTAEPEVVR